MFYNPTTHQTCICERAEFDKRYFPCLSGSEQGTVPSFALHLLLTPSTQSNSTSPSLGPPLLSDEGGDDDLPLRPTVEPQNTISSFPLTTTIVKLNIQNKFYATNTHSPGTQATPTSVGESPDSLNLISHASSRASKCVYPRGCSCAHRTVRRSFRSVSAAEDSRKASPELSSSSEEEKSKEKEVSPGPRTPRPLCQLV